jgi:hypothetical protein
MKTEIFNIAIPINAETAERAGASLKAIPGVHEVSFFDAPARLYARIDTTRRPAELVAALNQAGVLVDAERKPHAGGSCCGCGG